MYNLLLKIFKYFANNWFKLIYLQPKYRLGQQGAKEIKEHPFFSDIDWEMVLQKKYEPPFKPKVANERDLRHFDKVNQIRTEKPYFLNNALDVHK